MNSRRFALVMLVMSMVALFFVLGMRESIRAAQSESAAVRLEAAPANDATLPVIAAVTDFSLIDETGAAFGLADLAGKIWVADLMFTSCSGTCPILAGNMGTVQKAFAGDPAVRFVSISVDPDTDTPDRLLEYAGRMGADLATWHFLTGPSETVQDLAVNGFKVGSADEPIFHSNRFVLIDPAGNVRGYFTGTDEAEMPLVVEAIGLLKAEFGI